MVSACVDKKMRETMAKAKNKQTRQGKVQKGKSLKSSKQPSKNISLIISSRNHQICLCSVERGGL
jgi:cell division protein FtsI/penicillin-binding protein 2